jgi:hypothetical protein
LINSIDSYATCQTAQAALSEGTAKAAGTASFSDTLKNAASKTENLDDIFENASEKYGVDINLLKAVAKAESGFKSDAVSSCGAQGIMQLMPSTAASLGVSDSFDPEQNIDGGAKYLSGLLNKYGDTKLALAAYNAGSGNVDKYGGVPPFTETQNYVKRVMSYAGQDITAGTASVSGGTDTLQSSYGSGLSSLGSLFTSGTDFTEDEYRQFLSIFAQQLKQNALSGLISSTYSDSNGIFSGYSI